MFRQTLLIVAAALLVLLSCLVISCESRLPSGIITVEKSGVPLVYFRVMVNAGSSFDPEAQPGLAYFTANLLNKGTTSFDRQEIESRLDAIGATLEIKVDKEVVVISGKTLVENLEQFYAVFIEVLTAPSFPEAEVVLARQTQLEAIGRVRENDSRLSLAVFEDAIFAGHLYGHIVEGNETAVRGFSREDALDFYGKYYLQGNLIAGVGGDIDDSLALRLRADLAALPPGHIVRWQEKPRYASGRRVILVEKENRAQSHLRVGHLLDCDRSHKDYFPLRLVSCWLGEHREGFGQLFNDVREARGLAYGAYAYIEYFRQAGWSKLQDNGIVRNHQYFHMWTYPKETNFEFCLKLMADKVGKLTASGFSDTDFSLVQDYVRNHYAFMIETPDKKMGMLADQRWYELPDYVTDYQKNVEAVTQAAVKRAAASHLHADDLLMVAVVSDGHASMAELLTPGAVLELPSGTDEGDLAAVNAEIKRYDLKLTADDITVITADELFR